MSCGKTQCYSKCPTSTVTIQPPPFMISIPGPALHCSNQPSCIEQCNPCAPALCCEGITRMGCASISTGATPAFTSPSLCSPLSLPRSDCSPCRKF